MTKKTPRVHRVILPRHLAEALLNVPFADVVESRPDNFSSIGQRLAAAKTELESAVSAANRVLARNPLTSIIAEHAARQANKRGTPTVTVDSDGGVMLEVYYLSAGESLPAVPKEPRKSNLPSMKKLRQEATSLGIDWEPFGKAKTKLIAAMDAVRKGAPAPPEPKPKVVKPEPEVVKPEPKVVKPEVEPEVIEPEVAKPKRVRTAESVTPPQTVRLDGRKLIPLDDDDDVADLFLQLDGGTPTPPAPPAPPEPLPIKLPPKPKPVAANPRRGVPSPVVPIKRGGRSLSAIAMAADSDIDIDAILAQPTPKIPEED